MPITPPPQAPLFYRDINGHESFYGLIRSWINRSGWSFRAIAELAECAYRHETVPGVPDWQPGKTYELGALVVHDGVAYQALNETSEEPCKDSQQWRRGPSLRRVYPSQIHKMSHGSVQLINTDTFEALGTLNLYLVKLRSGEAKPPAAKRLAKEAKSGFILEDSDGPLGPEELLSIYLGRLQPPITLAFMSERQSAELCRDLGKRFRAAVAAAGMDIIEDWATLAAMHPSKDAARLRKLREIILGQGQWSATQVEDEEFALEVLIAQLKKLSKSPGQAENA